jgi:hypothetical protein
MAGNGLQWRLEAAQRRGWLPPDAIGSRNLNALPGEPAPALANAQRT